MADDEDDLWAQVKHSVTSQACRYSKFADTQLILFNMQDNDRRTRKMVLRRSDITQIYGEEAPLDEKAAIQPAPAALVVQQKPPVFAAIAQPGVPLFFLHYDWF